MHQERVLAIVEDDAVQAELAARMAKASPYAPLLSVMRLDGPAALEGHLASGGQVDILLTDIELSPEGADGVEMVRRLFPDGCGTQVIYFTGHIEHCTRVYQTQHVYFLTKPVDQRDFEGALGKALANLADGDGSGGGVLTVKSGGDVFRVPLGRVSHIESDRRKLIVHRAGAGPLTTYASLSDVADGLPRTFVRCHKSFYVNLDYVAELNGLDIRLVSGGVVPVSQRRRASVREALLSHLGEGACL